MKLHFSRAVLAARKRRLPVVALETSVVAQGLPYPQNLEVAASCEKAVREEGAEPAAIAVIKGKIHIGLSDADYLALATEKNVAKVGSKDLALILASGRHGGTTVSATVELASAAGIRVFATGGIGGVHHGISEQLDISQDLAAIARFPVAVVCAGAKSILDLPNTLELLESMAVPVVGVGTNDFPGFFLEKTGLLLEHRVENAREGARVLRARFMELGQGGIIFAVPPPKQSSLPRGVIERAIAKGLADARKKCISGKALTPFLLGSLVKATHGKSLRANKALLVNNARWAARLATALRG